MMSSMSAKAGFSRFAAEDRNGSGSLLESMVEWSVSESWLGAGRRPYEPSPLLPGIPPPAIFIVIH
jgi:hypothetical protein